LGRVLGAMQSEAVKSDCWPIWHENGTTIVVVQFRCEEAQVMAS
jgi:hypothetical protein